MEYYRARDAMLTEAASLWRPRRTNSSRRSRSCRPVWPKPQPNSRNCGRARPGTWCRSSRPPPYRRGPAVCGHRAQARDMDHLLALVDQVRDRRGAGRDSHRRGGRREGVVGGLGQQGGEPAPRGRTWSSSAAGFLAVAVEGVPRSVGPVGETRRACDEALAALDDAHSANSEPSEIAYTGRRSRGGPHRARSFRPVGRHLQAARHHRLSVTRIRSCAVLAPTAREGIGLIVVGLPRPLGGRANAHLDRAEAFLEALAGHDHPRARPGTSGSPASSASTGGPTAARGRPTRSRRASTCQNYLDSRTNDDPPDRVDSLDIEARCWWRPRSLILVPVPAPSWRPSWDGRPAASGDSVMDRGRRKVEVPEGRQPMRSPGSWRPKASSTRPRTSWKPCRRRRRPPVSSRVHTP